LTIYNRMSAVAEHSLSVGAARAGFLEV